MRPRRRRSAVLHSIFERALHEQRRALYGWSAGLALLALLMAALYPTVRDNPGLATLHESYPEALRSLFGIADLTTGTGYLRAEIFSLMGPLLLVILAVLWGSDLTAGEEERHTIDVLLANPVSRRRVVFEKWVAMVLGVGVAAAALGVVIGAGGPLVRLHVGSVALTAAVLSSWLLAVLFGSLALAVGAATGRRGLARGVVAAAAVAAYLLSSLPELVSWLRPLRPLSPWYHALGVDPLGSGLQGLHLLVLVVLVGLCAAVGAAAFARRDLGT